MVKFRFDKKEKGLFVGPRKVAQIEEEHIHLSLRWLRDAGFNGIVRVSENFADEPSFEVTVGKKA